MAKEEGELVNDEFLQRTVERHQDDLQQLKLDVKDLDNRADKMERRLDVHDVHINTLNESLGEIRDDTKWIRRMLTKIVVGAVVTAVIGTVITAAFSSPVQ
ncbi:hypothetical protein G4V62_19035 [Bacillaceae bacterium SIJ1]|uniref:hemolysin XhlA family protein n=1 Tax=Litoribacterium kuwaitense TaxID=1398745 RepID=UPI0013EC5A69|nr:hemolysin XhlA family protein [Litoribacterium kuwaitense]NGP46920.1 hypothetical protein [Litoribacterium kuwaitense]